MDEKERIGKSYPHKTNNKVYYMSPNLARCVDRNIWTADDMIRQLPRPLVNKSKELRTEMMRTPWERERISVQYNVRAVGVFCWLRGYRLTNIYAYYLYVFFKSILTFLAVQGTANIVLSQFIDFFYCRMNTARYMLWVITLVRKINYLDISKACYEHSYRRSQQWALREFSSCARYI